MIFVCKNLQIGTIHSLYRPASDTCSIKQSTCKLVMVLKNILSGTSTNKCRHYLTKSKDAWNRGSLFQFSSDVPLKS